MRKRSRQASGKVDLEGSENAPVRVRLAPDGHLSRVAATGIIKMSCAETSCCDEAATGVIAPENVAALGLAGCGRKGGLDLPPGATPAETSVSRPDLEPAIAPDGRVIAPTQGPKRSTPLDFLLN